MDVVQRALRLALEGESVKAGGRPGWLARACDFSITRVDLRSSTLELELPELGELVGGMLGQDDFWKKRPGNDDDVMVVFLRAFREMTTEALDGDFYDIRILEGLARVGRFLKTHRLEVDLIDRGPRSSGPAEGELPFEKGRREKTVTLNAEVLDQVSRLEALTPEPRRLLISGRLDMIRHRSGRFQLMVQGGPGIPGRVSRDGLPADEMRGLWGARVTVRGMVHFKASGEARYIEADRIQKQGRGQVHLERLPRFDD
ncbi:MAG: hypothetical protein AAF514_00720 [Verrucomicrobiota bacterium]